MRMPQVPHTNKAQKKKYEAEIAKGKSVRHSYGLARSGVVSIFMFLIIATFIYSASSASTLFKHSGRTRPSSSAPVVPAIKISSVVGKQKPQTNKENSTATLKGMLDNYFLRGNPFFLPLPQTGETLETYQADCTTPATDFNLGETVCVKVIGAPLGDAIFPARRLNWVSRAGQVVQVDTVLQDPQTFTFALPSTNTTDFEDTEAATITVDNRGMWKATLNSVSENSVFATINFNVHAPTPFVDLSVNQGVTQQGAQVEGGSGGLFEIFVTNNGPDAAQNVVVTDTIPANTTNAAITETTGLGFTCGTPSGGSVTCTATSLAVGVTARFSFTYEVEESAPADATISNTVTVSSDTAELEPADNTSGAGSSVSGTSSGETCSFDCPANITATANTTQGGNPGAFVSFSSANGISGNCGAINATPASGSFFPVGSTVVSVSSETGGGNCTFTVTVTNTPAPTISCPPDQTASDGDGDGSESVNVGTPTTNPATGVTVNGVRSDGLALNDPYPTGATGIQWTVTDSSGRSASCSQKVTVLSPCANDTTAPTITAPDDLTVNTGDGSTNCGVALHEVLGQATAEDDCSFTITVTGIPAGNFFPVGETTLTYTATDSSGHTASDTQKVTIVDNTAPSIVAPPDASYTCPSEVPAANASQATRGEVLDENGNPLPPGPPSDNCGTPTVTVSETSTGAGSASSPLVITRTFTATDSNGNSASAVQTITVTDGIAPTISAPADASYQCASEVPAADGSQATASDNCATPTVAVTQTDNGGAGSSASPLVITRTYTATDAAGNTASDSQTITVIDTTAPVITLNGVSPMTVECHTGFSDPGATATDNCTSSVNVTASGSVDANTPGTYTITYSATDAAGNNATLARTVNVVDTTAPVITLKAPISFWPPNHKYKVVNVTDMVEGVTDSCDTTIAVSNVVITKVTSDEAVNGTADGNTVGDIIINADCRSVQLRSERNGSGNGRVYTVTVKVEDASGNETTQTFKVSVPKNQSGGTAVDDGPAYTVNSSCP